jgi:hypothetical protein
MKRRRNRESKRGGAATSLFEGKMIERNDTTRTEAVTERMEGKILKKNGGAEHQDRQNKMGIGEREQEK